MKRFHVHVAVDDLRQSIGFYSALFAAQPSVVYGDDSGEREPRIAHTASCCAPQAAPVVACGCSSE